MQMQEHIHKSTFSMGKNLGLVNSDGQFLAIRIEVYAYAAFAIAQQAFEGRKMSLRGYQIRENTFS